MAIPDFVALQPPTSTAPARPVIADIRPAAAAPAVPNASANAAAALVQEDGANPSRNGRVAAASPANEWAVKPVASVPDDDTPVFLWRTRDRWVVRGTNLWFLLDAAGEESSRGVEGGGSSLLRADHGMWLTAESSGALLGRSVSNGEERWSLPLAFDRRYHRSFITWRDGKLLVVAQERHVKAHVERDVESACIEIFQLALPGKADDEGFLADAGRIAFLTRKEPRLLAALGPKRLVLAAPDRLWWMTTEGGLTHEARGAFRPIALSTDETERAYLLVEADKRTELWCVAADGARTYATAIPGRLAPRPVAPLIALDHRVYVLGAGAIHVFDPAGRLVQSPAAAAGVGGAVVASDGRLVATVGADLVVISPEGTTRVLATAPEKLLTAPLPGEAKDIWYAAGAEKIHRFQPK